MIKDKYSKIIDLVQIAITLKDDVFIDLEKVSQNAAAIIIDNFKIDVSSYIHVISTSEIRHTVKRHGKKSNDRNPVEISDFALIPIIHNSFDRIVLGGVMPKTKNQCIIFEKKIGDIYYCVEEIRDGRKKLAFVTMYKRKSRI
jgi:hypothetical protein